MPQTGIAVPVSNEDAIIGKDRTFLNPDDNSKFKILVAYLDAGNNTTFRVQGAGTFYSAPAAGFRIKQVVASLNSTASIELGYANASVDNGAVPSTPIYNTSGTSTPHTSAYLAAAQVHVIPMDFNIPSGKFPFFTSGSAAVIYIHGYEG
jgi:hypothetical protein